MSKNIFVVEDEVSNINSLYRLLKIYMADYNMEIHRSGEDAIDKFKQGDYALAVVDLLLKRSQKQGHDVIRIIRGKDSTIPIIVVTGVEYEGAPLDREYKQLGVSRWIKKPIKASELEKQIRTILEQPEKTTNP